MIPLASLISLKWICHLPILGYSGFVHMYDSLLCTFISFADNLPLPWIFVVVCKILIDVQYSSCNKGCDCLGVTKFSSQGMGLQQASNQILLYGCSLAEIGCR